MPDVDTALLLTQPNRDYGFQGYGVDGLLHTHAGLASAHLMCLQL